MRTPVLTFAFAITLAAALLSADDPPPASAKEMFFDPGRSIAEASTRATEQSVDDEEPQVVRPSRDAPPPQNLGLSYWIELISTAGKRGLNVMSDSAFRSGDRIRLHFRPNIDGNIVIVQLGTSGRATVLFPDPRKGLRENRIRANRDHIFPSETHVFRFDENPGTERLLALFARNQTELDQMFPTQRVMDAAATATLLRAVRQSGGSKDLFIETETEEPSEAGRAYVVDRAGKPIAVEIALTHR